MSKLILEDDSKKPLFSGELLRIGHVERFGIRDVLVAPSNLCLFDMRKFLERYPVENNIWFGSPFFLRKLAHLCQTDYKIDQKHNPTFSATGVEVAKKIFEQLESGLPEDKQFLVVPRTPGADYLLIKDSCDLLNINSGHFYNVRLIPYSPTQIRVDMWNGYRIKRIICNDVRHLDKTKENQISSLDNAVYDSVLQLSVSAPHSFGIVKKILVVDDDIITITKNLFSEMDYVPFTPREWYSEYESFFKDKIMRA